MAKKLQLMPLPDIGETITVTTKDCDLDSIILDISQRGVVKYFAAIRVNDDTFLRSCLVGAICSRNDSNHLSLIVKRVH